MPRSVVTNRLAIRNYNFAIYNKGGWYVNGNSAAWNAPYSIECFIKTSQLTLGTIFSLRPASENLFWGIQNGVLFGFASPGGGAINGSRFIADNYWHHVVITMSGTVANMYVDGALDGAANQASAPPDVTINFELLREPSGINELLGSMQDFRRYDKVLNLQEIQDSYFRNIIPSGLIDRFKFDEGSGMNPANSAGGVLVGTLRNLLMWTTGSFMKSRNVVSGRISVTGRIAIS